MKLGQLTITIRRKLEQNKIIFQLHNLLKIKPRWFPIKRKQRVCIYVHACVS